VDGSRGLERVPGVGLGQPAGGWGGAGLDGGTGTKWGRWRRGNGSGGAGPTCGLVSPCGTLVKMVLKYCTSDSVVLQLL
jgi:hypothetical protein